MAVPKVEDSRLQLVLTVYKEVKAVVKLTHTHTHTGSFSVLRSSLFSASCLFCVNISGYNQTTSAHAYINK